MLGADKKNIVLGALPDGLEQAGGKLHEPAGLPKTFIFHEQRDQVLKGGVARISGAHFLGDLLQTAGREIAALFRCLDALGVGFGNLVNILLGGQAGKQAFLRME